MNAPATLKKNRGENAPDTLRAALNEWLEEAKPGARKVVARVPVGGKRHPFDHAAILWAERMAREGAARLLNAERTVRGKPCDVWIVEALG